MAAQTLLPKDTYLAMLRNAEGSNLFRTLYMSVDGQRVDILGDGDLSCAFFVSNILALFKWIDAPHATVSGLEHDLKASGWHTTETPAEGDVIIWEAAAQKAGELHQHAGFYLGEEKAISNNPAGNTPFEHHYTFGTKDDGSPMRTITACYTRDF